MEIIIQRVTNQLGEFVGYEIITGGKTYMIDKEDGRIRNNGFTPDIGEEFSYYQIKILL